MRAFLLVFFLAQGLSALPTWLPLFSWAQLVEDTKEYNLIECLGPEESIPFRLTRLIYENYLEDFNYAHEKFLNSDPTVNQNLLFEYFLLVDLILSDFPPDNYIYVGVGASPTFIMAILESLGPLIETKYLPLAIKNDAPIIFTKATHRLVQTHMHDTLSHQKKYLLVDYTRTGKSLEAAMQLMRIFCQNNERVATLALRAFNEEKAPIFLTNFIRMPQNIERHIYEEHGKKYRKYPRIELEEINEWSAPLRENDEYGRLKGFFETLSRRRAGL